MKTLLTILEVSLCTILHGQDGSDILYYDPDRIDQTFMGKICHVDFGRVSFRGQTIDTVEIDVYGQKIRFFEHRVDNGYNNWFREQYLEALPIKHSPGIRLINSKIDSLTSDKIYVMSTLAYFYNKSPIDTVTVIRHWYPKDNIAKVLVKDD